jgi:putative sterol carrier protein
MPFTHGTPEWEEAWKKMTKDRTATQPRPFTVFSPEWIGEWEQLLQKDAKYKEVAFDWWESSLVLNLQKNPDLGVEQDMYLFMDLWHKDVRSIRYVPAEYGKKGNFVVTGTVERWLSVARKQLDPVKGMMQGKLKLKGDLPTIVRAVKVAVRLVETVGEVGGILPDELNATQMESWKKMIKELTADFSIT